MSGPVKRGISRGNFLKAAGVAGAVGLSGGLLGVHAARGSVHTGPGGPEGGGTAGSHGGNGTVGDVDLSRFDPTVFLERVVADARHVEVQVIADAHGTVWAPGVRDCSIQRRNQKVIEESASTALSPAHEARLREAATRLAHEAGYVNAGTVEFLFQPDQDLLAFLEVNTRLQVEHPVTEFITGIDIVKEQIRIAAGERLSFKQGDVTFNGHSIECRINAEDPDTFAPSPGVIHAFSVPGGPGVRIDTFAHSECTIPPYYDSMIAKIIVHGRDRQEAIARMRRTLEMTVIEGIKTSIPLHLKIINDPDFAAGRLSTGFMDRYMTPKKTDGRLAEAV